MKPGPAISAASTSPAADGWAVTAATIFSASWRGLVPSGLASCIATLQATSPWAAALGRSRVIVGATKPASDSPFRAWTTCFTLSASRVSSMCF